MGSRNNPDYIYNPRDWECTFAWADRNEAVEDFDFATPPTQFGTLISGPSKWAVMVALTLDENGDLDHCEVQWFQSEEAAARARAVSLKPL